MDVGSTLREARERAGFSLQDVATRTRIPIKSLRAIEENDFASVPSGIFVRGFIRSYAQEVGVDPAQAVADYRAMTEPAAGAARGTGSPRAAECPHASRSGNAAIVLKPALSPMIEELPAAAQMSSRRGAFACFCRLLY